VKRIALISICLISLGCQGDVTAQSGKIEVTTDLGAELYGQYCASCHGDNLEGGQAAALNDDVWTFGSSDSDLEKAIVSGIEEAGMPGFGDVFGQSDRKALIHYIRGGSKQVSVPKIEAVPTVQNSVQITPWGTGLSEPWSLVFTEPGKALVTEKGGTMRRVENGSLTGGPVRNIPEVVDWGQGGLFDVALDPDYSENGWIYLSFAHPEEKGSRNAMTKIIRGRISDGSWTDEETLFQAQPEHYLKSRVHYGGRITFDREGFLYFSIGDRGSKNMAQDLSRPNGKIHRIYRDGRIPDDNPFVDRPDAYKSIYSYGHRNPQGLVIHPRTNELWETEHGPKGGDELNLVQAGKNYGWPEISYGRNYNGTVLTPHTALPGMEQPVSHWTPSIAVCGLDVYSGTLFPEWEGRILAGALRAETVRLIDVTAGRHQSEHSLIKNEGRVRDVETGLDGAIYVALPDRIVRITPKP